MTSKIQFPQSLRQFDDMQLKERRFLSIYDYLLNLIAMLSIFMCLVLGAQQIHDGQLNAYYKYYIDDINFI